MATKSKNTDAISVAETENLKQADRIKLFGEKAKRSTSLFLEMGILFAVIDANRKGEKSTRQLLAATGADEKLITNGEYASHIVRELVMPGHLSEADYYKKVNFTSARAAKFALGEGAFNGKKKPTHRIPAETLAEIITSSKKPALDIESMATHKMLSDDYAAQQAEEAKAKAKADAEAAKAEEEETPEEETPETETEETPETEETETPETETEETETEEPGPEEETDPEEAEEEEEEETPAPAPAPAGEAFTTPDDALKHLDEFEVALAALPEGTDYKEIYQRIVGLVNDIGEQFGEPVELAKAA